MTGAYDTEITGGEHTGVGCGFGFGPAFTSVKSAKNIIESYVILISLEFEPNTD